MCRWKGNIIIDLKETEWKGMSWVNLAQARDKWRVLVNMVTNVYVPQNVGNFSTSTEILLSQERLCSRELVS
jgi:hypothetical protein